MKLQNLIHILIGIVCIGLLPGAQAVVPPPDGGYPEGNTAEGQNRVPSASPFAVGAAIHEKWADSQDALQFPNASEIAAEIETVSSAPPTRRSFMASWDKVAGATGYLLDVSTSSSFSDYVDGYHGLDVGNVRGRVVTGLNTGTTYYYRVRPYTPSGAASYSGAMTTTTVATTGLNIQATFDGSITGNPNAAAIQAMINRAISIYESLFSDPITIQIRFRYATTAPNGIPLPQGNTSRSDFVVYTVPWNTAGDLLRADARTSNDNLAIASLPVSPLSANIIGASANGRAVKLNTPAAMFANGTVAAGGPYDGIVTLNSAAPYQFNRPTSAGRLDAQRAVEHEINEVMGLGSRLGHNVPDLRPQDVFSWSSPGVRNLTSSGTRYFSINGGVTNLVNFNQNPTGDFGDWVSTACPQAHPYVQNAMGCTGQSSDVTSTSPEGVNLDVIGYDLVKALAPLPTFDFNNDGKPDYALYNSSTHQTAIWYMNNNVHVGSASGPTINAGWSPVSVADFNRDGHIDVLLFNPSTRQTWIGYLFGVTLLGSNYGPTLPSGWQVVAIGDFNGDGHPDYLLFNSTTHATVIWYMNNNVHVTSASGPTLPGGWQVVAIGDFNGDAHPDYLLFNSTTHATVIWYMNNNVHVAYASGPTLPGGWQVVGVADFNRDGHPDYLLFNSTTHATVIWYMNNNVHVTSASGPTIPGGWSLGAP
jgi:elongation factor P hydroxylase